MVMTRGTRSALVAFAAVVLAPSLAAQSSPAGPRAESSRAGVSASVIVAPGIATSSAPSLAPAAAPAILPAALPQNPALRRRGVPQMIIGGVAILGGAIIGDDVGTIISLAGLGYGIYGLYLYLN
jgi:hypothetical protein